MPLRFQEKAASAYEYPLIIRQLLASSALASRDQEIVYRDDFRLTYADLFGRIGRLASVLTQLGVKEGDTVAVMDWDSHRYLECFFAIPMIGAVLQTINLRLPTDEIEYCLSHANATFLLIHADFAEMADILAQRLPSIRAVMVMADGAHPVPHEGFAGEYEALLASASPDFPFRDFDENAVAATFYTTGTTGLPKGVTFTHRQIVLQTMAVAANFSAQQPYGFGRRDVYMPITPMFHVLGWCSPYVATLLGMKQVYPGRYEPATLLRLYRREGVSYSHCVPTIIQMLLDQAAIEQVRLEQWTIAVGGAALSTALLTRAQAAGLRLVAGYGMSETCSTVTLSRPGDPIANEDDGQQRLALAGIAAPLVHLRIVDEAMRDVPHDGRSTGEIVLRAPWLTPAYTANTIASDELWRDGWLHTQDVGTIDAQGYLRIVDRVKDLIKSGGEWISSVQLEELVERHPAVREAAIVGIADEKWGERPVAFVVAEAASAVTQDIVCDHLTPFIAAGAISGIARPDRVIVLDALPRTSVGKIDKKRLRVIASEQDVSGWYPREPLEE